MKYRCGPALPEYAEHELMATINDLSPSPELKARLEAAFPFIDVDVTPLRTLFGRQNLNKAQQDVLEEIRQLAIETVNE